MTAADIRKALMKRFNDDRRYAIAEEVGVTTGGGCRRLDMVVLDCYYSNNFRIDGIEIKVSKSDLRRELEDPNKHCDFFEMIDFFSLAAPAEVVNPMIDLIPKQWGIMIVNEDGSTRYKRKPLALRDEKMIRPVPRGFFASVLRALQSRSPAAKELEEAFERGRERGKSEAESRFRYQADRVGRELHKIDAYDNLVTRLRLWRDDNLDEIIDEFEAFRNLNTDWLRNNIAGTIKQLQELDRKLCGTKGQEVKT